MAEPATTDSLIAASLSDVGRTRKENQDACGEFRSPLGERLFITADGMGGHTGGATASRLCVDTVGRVFMAGEGDPEDRLRLGMEEANRAVHTYAIENPELTGMGTTAVAYLFAPDGSCWLGWVGDSRAYRFRDGQLVALSDDHSVVGEWVRNGVISEEEAEVHPRRNELMRAIGPEPEIEVDTKEVEIAPGDRFLLCSDGLCGYLRGPEIAAVTGFERPESAVRLLVDKVNEEHNSPDNVTVQIIEVPRDYVGKSAASAAMPEDDDDPVGQADRSVAATTREVDTSAGTESTGGMSLPPLQDSEIDVSVEPEAETREVPKSILVGVAVCIVLLVLAVIYAFTVGGGGVPVKAGTGQQDEFVVIEEEEVAPALLTAPDRAAERRQRIEDERASLAESRAERERQRAEAAQAAVTEEVATTQLAAAEAAPPVVSAALPVEPEPTTGVESFSTVAGPVLDLAIQAFLEDWARAAQSGNYALYGSLGMQETQVEFMRQYGAYRDLQVRFDGISHRPWADGKLIVVDAKEIVTYSDEVGTHSSQIPRSFVLRQTPEGLRYVDSRD